jgi:hypothetical protein
LSNSSFFTISGLGVLFERLRDLRSRITSFKTKGVKMQQRKIDKTTATIITTFELDEVFE